MSMKEMGWSATAVLAGFECAVTCVFLLCDGG
jgi:hypothetical protein